jgi:hypothetical protein
LVNLAVTADRDASEQELEERKRILEATGIDRLGALAFRTSLSDSALHTGIFLQVPSPRTGILALLDQPAMEAKPSRWVPASVAEYSHLNLDLGGVYTLIKNLVIQRVGEKAEQGFKQVEATVNGFAGTDLAAILSSLGRQHVFLGFEPKLQDVKQLDEDSPFAGVDRMAVVWAIENQEVWKRLLNASQAFAAMAKGTIEYREEQGFSGYRLTMPQADGGLFLGKGYLVLAIGEGVLTQTLSMLSHPPEGRDALVNSDLYVRAARLLPLQPGLSFDLADGNRYAGSLHQSLEALLDASSRQLGDLKDTDAEDLRRLMEQLRRLLPSVEEFQNVFGVNTSYMRATDDGLEAKTVSELPPP